MIDALTVVEEEDSGKECSRRQSDKQDVRPRQAEVSVDQVQVQATCLAIALRLSSA